MRGAKNETKSNGLTRKEQGEVKESEGLTSPQIFEVVRLEGEAELQRPVSSLGWSGLAAGLAMSLSIFCKGFFHEELKGSELQGVIANIGYTVGFLIVSLGRLQLFTENTITCVLPVLGDFSWSVVMRMLRNWAIVLSLNIVGTFIAALAAVKGGLFSIAHLEAFFEIARELLSHSAMDCFLLGIPAGFIIAAMVWLLPSAQNSEFWVVLFLTYMISLGGLAHVIAGSTEYFMLCLGGELSWGRGIFSGILPTLLGNILGGTGLFALISYGQVRQEIESDNGTGE